MVRVIADTHIHVYPCHDLDELLRRLLANLDVLAPADLMAMFLTERSDCHVFESLAARVGETVGPGLEIVEMAEREGLALFQNDWPVLCIYAGRQIVTKERLEILALTLREDVPDGLPAEDVVRAVQGKGAIPVLAWAPGKWSGWRGVVVGRLLSRFTPAELLIGDSTLRPTGWMRPSFMRRAQKRGFRVIAGSDPLPFAGDECVAGTYASRLKCDFDHEKPVASLRKALLDPDVPLRNVPKPRRLHTVLYRLIRNELVRRRRK